MLLRITQCPRIPPVLSQAGAGQQLVCISVKSDGFPLYCGEAAEPPPLPPLLLWAAIEPAVFTYSLERPRKEAG